MWVGTDYAGNDLGTSDYAIGAAGFLPFGKVIDKGVKYGGKTIGAIEKQSVKRVTKTITSAIERHHQLPRKFKDRFDRVGLDIEKYVIELDKTAHRLKPGGLHTGKGAENWNGAWEQFFDQRKNPSKQDILDQLTKMRKTFGLE